MAECADGPGLLGVLSCLFGPPAFLLSLRDIKAENCMVERHTHKLKVRALHHLTHAR